MGTNTISRPTARMLRGIMNGEAGRDGVRPDALQITRHKKDVFTFEIINSKGETLIDVCEVQLKTGARVALTDIYRVFNFTVGA